MPVAPPAPTPARLLAIMGSGETTPTMVKLHRQLFDRLGPPGAVRGVVVDTPYGFQSNASDISARAVQYFHESVGREVAVASWRRTGNGTSLDVEAALAQVAEAGWVFAGPGSPTYALSQWRSTAMASLLSRKLSDGGCVVFSSAAALTLGEWTVPVYEIYKAGADPHWEAGLGLMQQLGLRVAVIPHYDNAEGGNHDTRFCYLGEERLCLLEQSLPPDAWALGVDEHSAIVFDLGAGTAAVFGRGVVTLRHGGRSVALGAGEVVPIEQLAELALSGGGWPGGAGRHASSGTVEGAGGAEGMSGGEGAGRGNVPGAPSGFIGPSGSGGSGRTGMSPFAEETSRLSRAFDSALAERDARATTEVVLAMEELVHGWAGDTFESDDMDRARAELRRMVVRLGEAAGPGLADPRQTLGPLIEALLVERAQARGDRRYADADRVRDALAGAGVEVRDTSDGVEWYLQ